jgi:outer membrane protein assembly factor BamD
VRLWLTAVLLVGAVAVSGCSKKPKDEYIKASVSTLYHQGHLMLEEGQYRDAAKAFDEVERQHPYSVWARRAQLMSAYAQYLTNNYDEAILAAQRFLALHPGNHSAPYAYYLVALCYYEQISDVGRDQHVTEQALKALNDVVRRYPNSEYATDARLKRDLVFEHLAGKEMEVGRFYLKAGEYLAAILRFRTVVKKYNTTTHVPEALHRLTEAYLALGVVAEAEKTAAVLGYNYPGSRWYEYSYELLHGRRPKPRGEKKKSWLSRIF